MLHSGGRDPDGHRYNMPAAVPPRALLRAWQDLGSEFAESDFEAFAYDIWAHSESYTGHELCWVSADREQGDLACVPANAQLGDSLCFINGCPYHFAVRADGPENYKLLGLAHLRDGSLCHALGIPEHYQEPDVDSADEWEDVSSGSDSADPEDGIDAPTTAERLDALSRMQRIQTPAKQSDWIKLSCAA
jgi:hypothetical protein